MLYFMAFWWVLIGLFLTVGRQMISLTLRPSHHPHHDAVLARTLACLGNAQLLVLDIETFVTVYVLVK